MPVPARRRYSGGISLGQGKEIVFFSTFLDLTKVGFNCVYKIETFDSDSVVINVFFGIQAMYAALLVQTEIQYVWKKSLGGTLRRHQ